MQIVLALFAVLAGAAVSFQAPVNSELARRLGHPLLGGLVSFGSGLVALACVALVLGLRPPPMAELRLVPSYTWFAGGLLGVLYITTSIVLTPKLGVATFIALIVAGQMFSALLIDQAGMFGLDPRPLTALRALGAALLVLGVVLMTRR